MCSPGGKATMNSLMNEDTSLLLTTVHSYSLTDSTLSGTWMDMLSLTLTWQPKRQWSICSLREKWGTSVGRICPPPSVTCTLHWPQLPLPPQALDSMTPFSCRVFSRVLPLLTSSSLVPLLMLIFTLPDGTR